jgi:hypothetical protein
MKKILLICYIIASVSWFTANAAAERNITLPHREDFSSSSSIDDIIFVIAERGATVTRVQNSWRGGGDYCARIDPPTCTSCINGAYAALGSFHFTSTNTLNVAFALNVGTTYSSSAADVGGSLINKFIDIFNPSGRTGLLGLNDRGNRNAHEFGIAAYPASSYYYYGTPPSTNNDLRGIHFGEGIGTNDYAGKWIWINYVVDHNTGRATLRIWDRNGNYSSNYFSISNATVGATTEVRTIGGYYNESHPSRDNNSRLLIDDLVISNNIAEILPPEGFLSSSGSDGTAPATPDSLRIVN